jgi:hypothetical protein
MRFDASLNVPRWVAYFDLLGTRELLASKREIGVFNAYSRALDVLKKQRAETIRHAWFSDTFLMIAPDDSGESFAQIDLVARWFAYFLLCAHVPLRGAISCDHFYADFEDRIFLGRALVEAYEYGEGQDWIGLLLCPTAMARLRFLGLPPEERLNYALWDIPWKRRPTTAVDKVAACILGNWIQMNARNPCLDALHKMASRDHRNKVQQKYERTISFIDQNNRSYKPNGSEFLGFEN